MRVSSKEVLWKIDWPMRWLYEDVDFEPRGKDHAAPGGSYDTSRVIAKEISSCFFINQQTLITLIAEENIKKYYRCPNIEYCVLPILLGDQYSHPLFPI